MQEIKDNTEPKDSLREYFKRWSGFYRAVVYIFGPTYLFSHSPYSFLDRYFPKVGEKLVINAGSGPVRLRSDVKNYDITPYSTVDVVASLTDLPLEDASIDGFVCDNVLEHVNEPIKAVAELHRVLKTGGVGYISTPFLYPFHSSPYDYQRWTAGGLKYLLRDFSSVEVGVRSGLFSTLNVWLCYVLPSFLSFGSDRLYWLLVNISIFIFFPVKFLDIITNQLPFATHTAAVFYCVVKK